MPVPVYEEARFTIRDGSDGIIVRGCDSVSLVKEEDEDTVVITASHGEVLASSPTWGNRPLVLAAVFNDAGSNSVSRLPDLDKLGIPAATVSYSSAKIGDARSTYNDGIISHFNESAIDPFTSQSAPKKSITSPTIIKIDIEKEQIITSVTGSYIKTLFHTSVISILQKHGVKYSEFSYKSYSKTDFKIKAYHVIWFIFQICFC